jgi:hypothetical protein
VTLAVRGAGAGATGLTPDLSVSGPRNSDIPRATGEDDPDARRVQFRARAGGPYTIRVVNRGVSPRYALASAAR